MPIYEYQCTACGQKMEKLQKATAGLTLDCIRCGGIAKRMVSAAGFRLAGSGWYETDFKQSNQRNLVESKDTNTQTSPNTSTATKAKDESKE